MPSSSGGTFKLGCGVKRMGGCGLRMAGRGAGGVLLDGGQGRQSSYASMEDYTRTTGVNPLVRQVKGGGLEKLSEKISGLSLQAPKKRRQNIKFEL